jgi:hypothetical protein
MKIFSFCLICSVLLIFSISSKAQEINPYLVGTNLWYTNPSTTVWNLTKQCGVQTIRIGGNGYNTNMPTKQTILSWVKQIQAIGAEPIVQVSQVQSAAKAAELVTYLNVENKGKIPPVKFWNIGNEPWLKANRPSTSAFAATVAAYYKPIAEAMKAADSTILIYGPDECDYMDYYNDLFGGKNDIAGKIPGHTYYYCDGLSWHRYPQGSGDPATEGATDMLARIKQAKAKVDQVNLKYNRTGKDALQWGIGEYNSKGGPEVHTWGNGQMFGAVLGWCMEYEATYATSWSMFESGGDRTKTDFSSLDGNMKPRASYWHMEFVAKYFKGTYLKGTSSHNDLMVYGAQNENQLSVMVMNRGFGYPKEFTLLLNDTATSASPFTLKVNAKRANTYSDLIGPRTTQVFIFRGDSIIKINYSSNDFDKGIAPTLSTVTVSTQLPNSPNGLQIEPTSYDKTSLTWNDNSENEFGYIVEREISGIFKTIAMMPANSKSFADSGLSPESTYRYRVAAYNSLGKSAYSVIDTVTTYAAPLPKAFNGPHSIPGKIEAEDFDVNDDGLSYHDVDPTNRGAQYRLNTGVDIQKSTDEGGGFNVAYIATGEWISFLVESVTPGTYDIGIRTASFVTSAKKIEVYLDNVKVGQVVPVNTGGWQKWETKYIKNVVINDATPKLLKLKFTGADYNLNWIEFTSVVNSIQQIGLNKEIRSNYNFTDQKIYISSDDVVEQATVQVFNSLGQSFYHNNFSDFMSTEIKTSNWPNGIYLISVQNKGERYISKLRIDK